MRAAIAVSAAFALTPLVVEARITGVTWDPARSQSPTFGGLSFGAAGQYEKLRGTATGELDANHLLNKVITDIGLAANAAGKVTYSMDVFILGLSTSRKATSGCCWISTTAARCASAG